jgi:hypothetical protein
VPGQKVLPARPLRLRAGRQQELTDHPLRGRRPYPGRLDQPDDRPAPRPVDQHAGPPAEKQVTDAGQPGPGRARRPVDMLAAHRVQRRSQVRGMQEHGRANV